MPPSSTPDIPYSTKKITFLNAAGTEVEFVLTANDWRTYTVESPATGNDEEMVVVEYKSDSIRLDPGGGEPGDYRQATIYLAWNLRTPRTRVQFLMDAFAPSLAATVFAEEPGGGPPAEYPVVWPGNAAWLLAETALARGPFRFLRVVTGLDVIDEWMPPMFVSAVPS
jgi:hypothetical protein